MSDTESDGQPDTAVQEATEAIVVPTAAVAKEATTPSSPCLEVTTDPPEGNSNTEQKGPEPLVRHAELSYEDGNLVLVAENTMFQVHRSVLSRKSALFKDLLSLPQPDSEEKIDGLPVVRLLESAKDGAMLIDAIYNGEKYGTMLLHERGAPY